MRRLSTLSGIVAAVVIALNLFPVQAQTATSGTGQATVTLTDCQFDEGIQDAKHQIPAQCGSLDVPQDYAHPDSTKLNIQFVVLPPTKPNAKGLPIFHFEGGPGGSAIENFGQVWYPAYDILRQDHPVVLIDQRGIGRSTSLQCTEITGEALTELGVVINPQQEADLEAQRLARCLERLSVTTDPQFYTSNALADDTDAVRAALGYDQIDVFGNSYGTSLGQIYLKRHGDHVAGMVLDSIAGPWNFWTLDAPNNGAASLDKVLALCAADPPCAQKYPNLGGELQTALNKLDANPGVISGLDPLTLAPHDVGMTSGRLLDAIFQTLYDSAAHAVIPAMIDGAAHDDYTLVSGVLIQEAEQADQVSLGLYNSIVCSEIVPFYTPTIIKQYSGQNIFSQTSSPQADQEECKAWRSAELSAADVQPVKSDRPVLILSGNLDPITPVKYGQEAHARLSHSTLVVFPYQAHGVIVNSKCGQTIVAQFFNAPTQPVDTTCVANDLKPLFLYTYTFPMSPFHSTSATFSGVAPQGWKAEQDGALTFFTNSAGTQFAAAGVFKNQTPDQAQQAALDLISKRYGTVELEEQSTVNALVISIQQAVHSLDRPDQAYTGIVLARSQGSDTYLTWQAAPNAWFQAVSAAIAPQMLAAIQAN